jgi:hypothetical protein
MASAARIPNFVVAGDVKSLRRAMLLNNAKLGSEVVYFDIQFAQGKWYAWFFEDMMNALADEATPKATT